MSWPYRPDLDGLRSIAVYTVLLFHCGLAAAAGGFIGVDLFFVLSGFLVSNVILQEIHSTGRLSFSRFYARRVRRLLPAAVAVVVATSLVFLLVVPVARRIPLVADGQSALLYYANWNFLAQQNDYFATEVDGSPFLHFWSLAIEEQFYFLFPLLLVFLLKAGRGRPRLLPGVLVALLALSLASQLYWARVDVNWAYYGTDARLYQLLAGALLAVALRGRGDVTSARGGQVLAMAGVGGVLLLASGLLEMTPSWRGVAATVASVVTIAGLMASGDRGVRRLLTRPVPVYLGKISYGTYLWHWPVILVIGEVLAVGPVTTAALAVVLSTSLATASYELFEMPVRTNRVLRRFDWPVVVTAVSASALVAVTVVPAVLESQARPRLAQAALAAPQPLPPSAPGSRADWVSRAERRAPVPTDIDWAALLDDDGPAPACSSARPDDCVVVRGDGPRVALVGDSHARMLGPMFIKLAEEHDLTLTMNVLPACSWQAGIVNLGQPSRNQALCADRRERWYEQALPRLAPDLVVLVSSPRDEPEEWEGRLVRPSGAQEETLSQLTLAATLDTVGTIVGQGTKVLIVEAIMGTGGVHPLDCLSASETVEPCQVPVPASPPVSDAYYRIAAHTHDGVSTLDLNPVFCVGEPLCLPMVDGVVVWKNKNHLTTRYGVHRRHEVWRAIRATGLLPDR